ncbi:MAG: hypothetical protein IJ198_06185 [Lachnospiraceae bacterium]|nr:hypothetical protein [Lachnospiraceae bacterium]
MNSTLKNVVIIALLIAGMLCLMWAKVSFQRRQQTEPDNVWSKTENLVRKVGYGILIADVIIAGFINF